MRIAISVSNRTLASADALAKRLKISRSQLYAVAVAEYVAKYQSVEVRERLDAVYRKTGSKLEPHLASAQRRALRSSEW